MPERPQIPSDLKRRILVEAGHRCAIHTCRYPTVEIHHIVPWEKCREHSYENLIALCANCHSRADSGEIDRKSLVIYKNRLSAAIVIESLAPLMPGTTVANAWRTEKITGSERDEGFEIEIPQFHATDLEMLNHFERGWAAEELLGFRNLEAKSPPSDEWSIAARNFRTGSFEIVDLTPRIVSIRYAITDYFTGAAHPNT